MFLLLPFVEEFPREAATDAWPSLDGIDAWRLAQYLAVIGALGAQRNAAALLDPVLRLAFGVPSRLDASALSAWSRQIEPSAIRRSLRAILASLRRLGKVSGAVTVAPMWDGVVAVDGERGLWLGTAPASPGSIRSLVTALDEALGGSVAVTGSEAWIESCLEPGRLQPPPIDLWALARLGEQARYVAIGAPFDLARPVRDLLMLASQALGRELAWRLPGFSHSSLPYLSTNILSFPATVVVEPERFVVHLGDPPLHVVLSLAGMNRTRFRLGATGDREWVLTREP